MTRFADKVVFVTGASSGIGAAAAAKFGDEGAHVVGVDIAGDDQQVLKCDVTSPDSVQHAIDVTLDRHGGIDVVVNAAGVMKFSHFTELAFEEWNRQLAVNLTGPFLVSQAAMPSLLGRRGNIVTVASNAGVEGQPYNAAYCASKGGVVLLMKALAVEYSKRGVRVNCICPGGVDTPLIAGAAASIPSDADPVLMARLNSLVPRWIPPAEIAELIAFVASDHAASMTGAAIMIDGGGQS
jgi:meso-butanediol dehydrogenase / (S,S)-butanediol dehydrogenase / diacetyl reductase